MFSNPDITEQQTDRQVMLKTLYLSAFPLVARHINKSGGTIEEAKDIFHDALVIYIEKTAASAIELSHSEKSYIFGIARHLWSKRLHSKSFSKDGADNLHYNFDADYQEIETGKLLQLLKSTGQKCLELLSAFYYEKIDMEKLAQRFGFSGARSATVQKFKCLEKVKNTVKIKSLHYEDFME